MRYTLLSAVVCLAVGAVGGVLAGHLRLQPQLEEALQKATAQQRQLDALQRENTDKSAAERAARLEKDNAGQAERIRELQKKLEEAQASLRGTTAPAVELAADPVENAGLGLDLTDPNAESSPRASNREDPEAEDPAEDENATRAEWAARREEFANQFRDGVYDFLSAEFDKTNDPVVQQRLTALSENFNYMSELRNQMRDAATDEEREALREEFGILGENMRQLGQEQQQYMLSEVARQAGVTDPQKQQQFLESLQSTMETPFFRFGGGGGGPPGGGRGGGDWGRGRGRGGNGGPGR